MEKIDRRRKYFIVLDTETCPMDILMGGVVAKNMLCYNIGFAVVDRMGRIYATFSFVVRDVFCGEKELMQSAYYAKKIPFYWEQLKSGEMQMASFYEIKKCLAEVMEMYDTNIVIAHNAYFDYTTLQQTQRWLTKSKYRFFLPFGTVVWDTMKMANDTICKMPTYRRFCEDNGYLTKNGRVRKTAEVLYRFISKDYDFEEEHTALADVIIEKEIFAYCMKKMTLADVRPLFG